MWAQFDTQSQSKDGKKTMEKFKIKIFRYNPDGSITERDFRNWSGGERRRISLAIDLGISDLMKQRAIKPWSFSGFDEIDTFLDDTGRDYLLKGLKEMAQSKESLLVVAHDAQLKSQFPNIMTVRKEGGTSKIVNGVN